MSCTEGKMDRLRVLVLGAAFSADLHMNAYAAIRDRVEIAAIADLDAGRAKALEGRYGIEGYGLYGDFREAIAKVDCDLVDICLPNFLHCEPSLLALESGRHVICEKPMATTVADAERMTACAKANGRHIYYAEDWLFAPALRKALEIVRSGGIGELQYIRARECHGGSHSPFAQKIEYCGGGSMIHLGIHPVGFVLAAMGGGWREVVAMASGGGAGNIRHNSMEGEDWAAAMIKFIDGRTALVEGNYLTCGGMEDSIDFYGTSGCQHADLTFSSALSCFSAGGLDYTVEKAETTTGWSRPAVDEKYNMGYNDEIARFVELASQGREADKGARGEDGLEALRLVECIYRSAREGVAVRNPYNDITVV